MNRLIGCLAVCAILIPDEAARAQVTADTVRLAGLRAPVEILRDVWGVSHIYAQNEEDLFFAQGFNAARDRLFQLELWRRRATGTMAGLVGRRALEHDIGARLLQFRGDMRKEMRHYHPRGRRIVTAFVAGINAYIDLTVRVPELLPWEFAALEIKPGKWTPAVVVSRHNGLYRNANRELELAAIVHSLGPQQTKQLLAFEPGSPSLTPDASLDLGTLDSRALSLYRASRSRIRFEPQDMAAAFRAEVSRHEPPDPCSLPERCDAWEQFDRQRSGSNNWVVSGARTFSGAPMMANDPHRVLSLPSLRYWVHLVAPGWNVIGGGEPALPGVAIGHNEHGAWGLTIFAVDQEDLYVYDTNPANERQYRYGRRWVDMLVVSDTIPIRDEAPVAVELRFTRHGPVLFQDEARNRAYALRAAWLEVGSAPYLASLRIDQARNWEEFREACAYFYTPSENMVWADATGNIGWQATGITPRRRGWDGLLPVPGDGRFEWDGFVKVVDLPSRGNPEQGWLPTANDNNLPSGYRPIVGYEWTDPFRISRIREVLGSSRRLTLMDMQRLQHDELSLPARSLVPLLEGLDYPSAAAGKAADRLLRWDYVLDRDSDGAAIYVFWEQRLVEQVWRRLVPEAVHDLIRPSDLSLRKVVDWITVPDGRLGPRPSEARDGLLVASLQDAVTELSELLGEDQSQWRYGLLKHVFYEHSLSAAVRHDMRDSLDIGPLPRGGYGHTVNYTSDNLNQTSGATFRIIVDTSDWDRSLGTNAPGQSGNPTSPHYGDLFVPWAAGKYFSVLYSRERVESATADVIVLHPTR